MNRLRGVAIDLEPLRASRDFRLIFTSRTITLLGSQATEVALLLQLKDLTNSPLAVGLLGLVELVVLIVFGLWGGLLADRLDRRRLLGWTEIALAGATALLLGNAALTHPLVWPIYGLAAVTMALAALQRPSLDATVPRTVERQQLTAASALLGATINFALILGATLGGVMAAELGASSVYALDVASFGLSALCLLLISRSVTERRAGEGAEEPPALAALGEGLRYVVARQELIGSYVVDIAAMTLGSVTSLVPFVAGDLHANWSVGLMYAAGSVGALIAALLGGWTSRVTRYGRAISASGAVWGLAMIGFGLSDTVALALVALVIGGGADMYSGVFRESLWNRTIPDELRGRVAGIELLSYGTGPSAGQLRAGAVASLTGVRAAIWSGGVLCVAAVAGIYALLPDFARFTE